MFKLTFGKVNSYRRKGLGVLLQVGWLEMRIM